MSNQGAEINNWNESYLNTLETLYGVFDLHPDLTIAELGDAWKECFRADGQGQLDSERSQTVAEWSESYLDDLEILHGGFNLHPALTIQELCEEWQECFMSNINNQKASRNSLIMSSKTE